MKKCCLSLCIINLNNWDFLLCFTYIIQIYSIIIGGGLGGTRKGGPDVNTKYSGREDNFR